MLSTSSSVSSFSYKPKLANLTATNYSQFSILNAMDRFVNSVDKMQSTILVPSRLKDLQLENEQITLLGQSDAYTLFMMLDEIKRELLWGPSTGATQVAMESIATNLNNLTLTSSELSSTPKESSILINRHKNGLIKCNSSASLTFSDPIKRLKKERTFSTNDDGFSSMNENSNTSSNSSSLALSDEDDSVDASSETEDSEGGLQLNTNKNKLDNVSSVESKDTFHLTAAFRLHLRGLSALCNQLADTAEFITEKYQNELK